jgi:integrase
LIYNDLHFLIFQAFTVFFYGCRKQRRLPVKNPVKNWSPTSLQGVYRHKSGMLYARFYAGGKEKWQSLRTPLIEVARERLRIMSPEIRAGAQAKAAGKLGRMTVGDCVRLLVERLEDGRSLSSKARHGSVKRVKPSSIRYRKQTLQALLRSWEGLEAMDARAITVSQCERWAREFAKTFSPTRYNNTLSTLRFVLDEAVRAGAILRNPAYEIARESVRGKKLTLPSSEQFKAFIAAIRGAGGRFSADCADFVEGLAYTGARKTELNNVLWGDVDLHNGTILLRVTKNGDARTIPMLAAFRRLVEGILSRRGELQKDQPLFAVREAQRAMDNAARQVGMERITHHDLRHLFATRCIESGVDVPTVARWLGHRDGGALAMRTYGHLREEHSRAAAAKVTF